MARPTQAALDLLDLIVRIIIIGAGAVGSYLAERMSQEGQDVVVVEHDATRAATVQEALDALVLVGNGASRGLLREAGAATADLLIAVSNSDGVNLLACHAAHEMGTRTTVARVEDPALIEGAEDLGANVVIDPGEMAAHEVLDLVGHRGVSDLVEFADGKLMLVGSIMRRDSQLLGRRLADLRRDHDDFDWAVGAIVRHGETMPVRGDTVIREHDHVVLMARTHDLPRAQGLLRRERARLRRVLVMGATRMAELATDMLLTNGFDVVVVDHDEDRCRGLAERHPRALVINGDPTDPAVMADLQLSDDDAVAALSGWDEVNLTASLVAKAMGAGTAISRFHRLSYISLMVGADIDASVSSRLAAASAILHYVRRGRIHSVVTFKDTDSEALDIEVAPGSRAEGQLVMDLDLPTTAVIGGISRDGDAAVPVGSTRIHAGDRLIVLAPAEAIGEIEALCTA